MTSVVKNRSYALVVPISFEDIEGSVIKGRIKTVPSTTLK
jgi:hypothetical protein